MLKPSLDYYYRLVGKRADEVLDRFPKTTIMHDNSWRCFGPIDIHTNVSYDETLLVAASAMPDFDRNGFRTDFTVEMGIISWPKLTAYRWFHPYYKAEFKQECIEKNIDAEIAMSNLRYETIDDIEVFFRAADSLIRPPKVMIL